MSYPPQLTSAEQVLVETARDFAREQVAPHAAGWERERRVPLETFRAAAEAGLARLLPPPALGGHGVSRTALAAVMEELAAACLPFAFMLVVHNNLAGNIAANGSPGQIERFLPPLLSGERVGAFCLTEPGAGSDAAAIVTSAREEPDAREEAKEQGAQGGWERGWVLDGEKSWITNGAVAGLFSVYAQSDPSAGWRGIVCLLVEGDTPGLTRLPPYALLGGHAMGAAGLVLSECRVPPENLLLPAGRAFKAAMEGIDLARTVVAAMCCGLLRSGLETALEYTKGRRAFGRSIAEFQGLQWQLADVSTDLAAARLLTYDAAARLDRGAAARLDRGAAPASERGEDAAAARSAVETSLAAAHAKKFATRVALRGVAECMQAMGAEGLKAEHPLGRHLASAKIAQYLDGTTEIQNVVISRALFGGR